MKGFFILNLSYPIFHSSELRFKKAKPIKKQGISIEYPCKFNLNQIHYHSEIDLPNNMIFCLELGLLSIIVNKITKREEDSDKC